MHFLRVCVVCLASLCWLGVAAVAQDAVHAPETPIQSIEVVSAVALDVTSAQIAAMAADRFTVFNDRTTYPLNKDSAIWLRVHMQLQQSVPAKAWTLEIAKPLADAVEFYARDPQGQWARQTAGTRTAHQNWPVRGLHPQFYLPAMNAGTFTCLVRILQNAPISFAVNARPTEHVVDDTTRNFLVLGVALGLLLLMLVLAAVLAVLYRKSVYAWYALYVGLALLAAASYTGFASYAFWPGTVWWPINITLVFTMACTIALLQFTRAMFLPIAKSKALNQLVSIATMVAIAATLVHAASDNLNSRLVTLALCLPPCFALMVVLSVRALLKGSVVARLWAIAYVPLLVVAALVVLENLGLVQLPWMPPYAPIYALLFEAPVLLTALHLHAKAQYQAQVQAQTLANADPLTGVATVEYFRNILAVQWARTQRSQKDCALVYIKLAFHAESDHDESMQRVVRLLRTVAGRHDVMAQLDGKLLGILIPNALLDDALANRLSRWIALGLMADSGNNPAQPIHLRIAVGTFLTGADTLQQLHTKLYDKINETKGWTKRSIRYVTRIPLAGYDTTDLSPLLPTA
jgi:GGDEF domain-containing protein